MTTAAQLIDKLSSCRSGIAGWREFEDVCVETLIYLFVPPLEMPKIQKKTLFGIDRRDAVFPNRNFTESNAWGQLFLDLRARLIPFEFKNYDNQEIGKDEVDQTRNYLTKPMGRLAIIVCSKTPSRAAFIRRNEVYNQDEKVILFLDKHDLNEMLFIKERGEDPADFILDILESFYVQHE